MSDHTSRLMLMVLTIDSEFGKPPTFNEQKTDPLKKELRVQQKSRRNELAILLGISTDEASRREHDIRFKINEKNIGRTDSRFESLLPLITPLNGSLSTLPSQTQHSYSNNNVSAKAENYSHDDLDDCKTAINISFEDYNQHGQNKRYMLCSPNTSNILTTNSATTIIPLTSSPNSQRTDKDIKSIPSSENLSPSSSSSSGSSSTTSSDASTTTSGSSSGERTSSSSRIKKNEDDAQKNSKEDIKKLGTNELRSNNAENEERSNSVNNDLKSYEAEMGRLQQQQTLEKERIEHAKLKLEGVKIATEAAKIEQEKVKLEHDILAFEAYMNAVKSKFR